MSEPFYNQITLLLPLGDLNDYSRHERPITPVGQAQIGAGQAKYYGSSLILDGAGDYLRAPNQVFSAYDWTIRFWCYPLSAGVSQAPISQRASSSARSPVYLLRNTNGTLRLLCAKTGGTWDIDVTSVGTVPDNAWSHVEIVRSGAAFFIFINGIKDANTGSTTGALISNSDDFVVGAGSTVGDFPFHGHFNDFEITIGLARHIADFTPPGALYPVLPVAQSHQPVAPRHRRRFATGFGRINDFVELAGPPLERVSRRVRLYDKLTGRLLAQTWSGDDGAYEFTGLDLTREYIVIGEDHERTYNAVIADFVTAALPS